VKGSKQGLLTGSKADDSPASLLTGRSGLSDLQHAEVMKGSKQRGERQQQAC